MPLTRSIRAASAALTALSLLVVSGSPVRAEGPFEAVILDNGLTVLLAPSAAHPVIALSCFVTTGGRTEDEYYQGSLHYIEHLVYKGGTPNLEPTEFRKTLSLLGREAGGWTWDDEINFGFEVPKENFREALDVFQEALLDLQYEEQWFEDEKLVVLQEMTRGEEQPGRMVYRAWNELAYNVHPYGRSVIGTEKAILELDMKKTEQYYRDRFTPNHMILSITGDFDRDVMLGILRETWGALDPGPDSFELGLTEPTQRGARTRDEYVPQATSAILLTGVVTPGGPHEDTAALDMLAQLMNDSSYGLPQYLVEQHKWVSSVSADYYPMRDSGNLHVFARLDADRVASVTEFVESFLLEFDVMSVPEEIFEEARRELLFEEARQRATAADRAERHGLLVSRRGVPEARQLVERYQSLTREDVRDAKERWVGPRRLVTVRVFPEDHDPETAIAAPVAPGAPFAATVPDLEVPGGHLPATADPLAHEMIDSEDGVFLYKYVNGLRLLVRPTSASELLAVSGRVLGGQWVEPEGKEGINLFLSEMGLRSTRRWDREGFTRLLGARSITASAHTSVGSRANTSRNVDYRDAAAQHYLGLSSQWPTMLASLKESLFFTSFDSTEVEKLRADLATRNLQLLENNLEYIKREFYETAYAGHPYGRPTFGSDESIAAITIEDLAAHHEDHWVPSRTLIAVVGDVDPDEVAAWIASRWADLDPTPAQPWSLDPAEWPLEWSPPAETQVLDLGKDYWTVNWGRPGATSFDPSFHASVVLSRMAGNDHFYKYVYGEGVSYRSWIRFWEHLGPGAWIVENDVKRDRFDEILGMFDEDLTRYSTRGFTEKEFLDAVQRLVNGVVLDAQNNARLAWKLAVAEGNGVGFRRETTAVDRLRAVAFEDVQALAAEIFAPEQVLRMVQQ